MKDYSKYCCTKCGEPRMNTTGYSTCAKGCERLHVKMPRGVAFRFASLTNGMREARHVRAGAWVFCDDKDETPHKRMDVTERNGCKIALGEERMIFLKDISQESSHA